VEEEFEDTKRGNQNSYIEEEQTTQWLKEKVHIGQPTNISMVICDTDIP
jgi:hypothetical protein